MGLTKDHTVGSWVAALFDRQGCMDGSRVALSHTTPSMIPRVSLSAARLGDVQKRTVASDVTEVKAVMLVRTTLSLSALVDLCVYSDSVDSSLVFWAPHGDHAFLTVFAVFVVGMTVFAMESEEGCPRRCGAHEPDLAHLYLRVVGRESSRKPGRQQGLWFPVSLTGKTCEDQQPWMAHYHSGAALSVLSKRVPVARLEEGVRGLSPRPVAREGAT